ncbi:GNAT family N-acetyltransferase [Sulfurimonas sp. NWX367]|uniref:GNAT family N-acetyltransferase n=1 Tax=Sulfurimonas sp. NWX367 TaxID=2925413 RepID=UPI00320488D5
MIIRKAKIKDFLKISKLDREAWGENAHADFVPDGEHVWRLWVEYAIVYCAEEKKNIIGVILAFPTKNISEYFLHKIFIDYQFRQQEIGKKLFHQLCNELDKKKFNCSLTTAPNNEAMKKLCKTFNFNEINFIKSYYRKEEDRLFYTRKFITKQSNE